jgi:hypothetical protein
MARPRSLVPLQESQTASKINFCLYSHPGEGKTVFWGTGNERILILDSDPGMGTQSAKALGSTALVMPVTDYDELQESYEYCKHELHKDFPKVEWIAWDSITLFQDRTLIDDIMVDAVAENSKQDEYVPSQRQYLQSMNRIGRYTRLFVELPFHFGVSCHVEMEKDDKDGSSLWMPQIQGRNMPSKIAGYMNVVGYMDKAKTKEGGKDVLVQRILFERVGKFYAKDRFNTLGNHVDRPTLPKVEQLLLKSIGQSAAAPTPIRRPRRIATQTRRSGNG